MCAAAWAPLIGFILLERKHSFSVSQWGPALMGFTDATRYLVLFLAFMALYLGIARTQAGEFLVNARVYQVRWRAGGVRVCDPVHAHDVFICRCSVFGAVPGH